ARGCQAFRTFDTLPMFEHMVTSGAWWDFVDDIASHRLRELLERFPAETAPQMRAWSRDPDMWKRRSAILCQLGRREQTDLDLLFDCIEPNLSDREFFIRKGIGWALRDLAYSNLGVVEEYVERNRERMSALSAREALKNAEKLRSGGRRPSRARA
ncbi:MAG: DNA alkylation repair protein, partial [Chloroflexota bacterium]|nr:DNA alkylation repair protein [Chloroflexota bacterium]